MPNIRIPVRFSGGLNQDIGLALAPLRAKQVPDQVARMEDVLVTIGTGEVGPREDTHHFRDPGNPDTTITRPLLLHRRVKGVATPRYFAVAGGYLYEIMPPTDTPTTGSGDPYARVVKRMDNHSLPVRTLDTDFCDMIEYGGDAYITNAGVQDENIASYGGMPGYHTCRRGTIWIPGDSDYGLPLPWEDTWDKDWETDKVHRDRFPNCRTAVARGATIIAGCIYSQPVNAAESLANEGPSLLRAAIAGSPRAWEDREYFPVYPTDNDNITKIVVHGDLTYVFKSRNIYICIGEWPFDGCIPIQDNDHGCPYPDTIKQMWGGIVYLGSDGYVHFLTGMGPSIKVSDPDVTPYLQSRNLTYSALAQRMSDQPSSDANEWEYSGTRLIDGGMKVVLAADTTETKAGCTQGSPGDQSNNEIEACWLKLKVTYNSEPCYSFYPLRLTLRLSLISPSIASPKLKVTLYRGWAKPRKDSSATWPDSDVLGKSIYVATADLTGNTSNWQTATVTFEEGTGLAGSDFVGVWDTDECSVLIEVLDKDTRVQFMIDGKLPYLNEEDKCAIYVSYNQAYLGWYNKGMAAYYYYFEASPPKDSGTIERKIPRDAGDDLVSWESVTWRQSKPSNVAVEPIKVKLYGITREGGTTETVDLSSGDGIPLASNYRLVTWKATLKSTDAGAPTLLSGVTTWFMQSRGSEIAATPVAEAFDHRYLLATAAEGASANDEVLVLQPSALTATGDVGGRIVPYIWKNMTVGQFCVYLINRNVDGRRYTEERLVWSGTEDEAADALLCLGKAWNGAKVRVGLEASPLIETHSIPIAELLDTDMPLRAHLRAITINGKRSTNQRLKITLVSDGVDEDPFYWRATPDTGIPYNRRIGYVNPYMLAVRIEAERNVQTVSFAIRDMAFDAVPFGGQYDG